MSSDHETEPVQKVRATIETAMDFGLDPREICDVIAEVSQPVFAGEEGERLLDELSAVLAGRILEHERGVSR